ncbi:MAG: DUF4349 domain-containing protein [Oscillospiraceae bacterium]|jgi:hypothetical protein|nr:DUF4349 domain-containing protein [Oscillospiraceae bacterium]
MKIRETKRGRGRAVAGLVLLASLLCAASVGCSASYSAADSAGFAQAGYGGGGSADYGSNGYGNEFAMSAEAPAPGVAYTEAGGISSAPVVTRSAATLAEKIIYSASVYVESVEFEKALEALSRTIEECGAFIESSGVSGADYESSFYGRNPYRSADYTIRVPRENFDRMLESFSGLGNVTHRSTSAENVTEQYMDTEARLKTYRIQEERLLAMLEKADAVTDMITIESSLSGVRYDIESLTSSLANMDNRVSYSSVYVNIREVEKLTPPEQKHQPYWQKIAEGLKGTFRAIGDFGKEALRVFIVSLPVLVIFAAVAAAVALAVRRAVKKRRKSKASAESD